MKKLTEGIFAVRDFSKDKTWLINTENNEEIEIDEGLDVDHEEFVKMKKENISPNLYCIIEERNGKKTFREAHVTNIDDIEDVREALNALMPGGRTKKTGRNEPCPCNSGKKYKKCCISAEG